jgi:hypothetical protein
MIGEWCSVLSRNLNLVSAPILAMLHPGVAVLVQNPRCFVYFILFYFVVLRNCQRCCRTLRLTVQKHHSIRNKELFYSLLGILSLLTSILDVSGKENNNNKAFRPLLGACEGYYSLETS